MPRIERGLTWTRERRETIRAMLKAGYERDVIARRYNVDRKALGHVIRHYKLDRPAAEAAA